MMRRQRGPKPTMAQMWEMIRLLQKKSPAARELIKDLYERRGTVGAGQLWKEVRLAARAAVKERGKGLTAEEYREFVDLGNDWPFQDEPDPLGTAARVNVHMRQTLLDRIEKEATKDGLKAPEFIRRAVIAELARRDAAK